MSFSFGDTHTQNLFIIIIILALSGFCELTRDGGGHGHQPHFSGGSRHEKVENHC